MSKIRNTLKNKILRILSEEKGGKYIDDSLDAQIDSLLISYDEESSAQLSEATLRSMKILLEQEEEEVTIDVSDEEEGSDADKSDESDALDINIFTRNVARLIKLYEKLLSVDVTILKRSFNYLEENYDLAKAKEFKELLREEYDIELPEESDERMELNFSHRPPADGAGPAGGGA